MTQREPFWCDEDSKEEYEKQGGRVIETLRYPNGRTRYRIGFEEAPKADPKKERKRSKREDQE